MHADSWIWIEFAVYHKFALFCFGLRHWSLIDHILPVKMCGRHASWGSIECDLCRKCNSSVKV